MSINTSQNPNQHNESMCFDCTRGRACRVMDSYAGRSFLAAQNPPKHRKVMSDEEIGELLKEHYKMDAIKQLIEDEDEQGRRVPALRKMSKRKKNNNHKQPRRTKDPVRPTLSVEKPNGKHMPWCSNVRCKRRVSDARKTRCAHCASSTSYSDYGYDYLHGYMD